MKTHVLALFALLATLAQPALSQSASAGKMDPVGELLRSAYQKYQKGDLAGASADVDKVKKAIDDKRASAAFKFLPDVSGWTGEASEKKDLSIMGGGASLQRNYSSKEKSILAQIIMDSPVIAQLAPLLSNASIAQGAGFEIRRIDGKDALVKSSGTGSELNVWLGSGMLFKLEGKGVKDNEIVTFAKNFDIRSMEGLRKEMPAKGDNKTDGK